MSHWSIEFSTDAVSGHAWGKTVQQEFAAYDASLYVLVHASGSVYLTITGQGCDDVLVFDFGTFWQAATIKRWGLSRVTYRGDYGGLFLAFHDGFCLEGFEDCCDRVLRVYSEIAAPPTLKDLQDLGIVPLPKVVGSFLVGLPDDNVSNPHSPLPSDTSVSSDEESDMSDEESDTNSSVYTADSLSEDDLAAISEEIGEMYGMA